MEKAVQMLIDDHNKVKDLFEGYESMAEDNYNSKNEIAMQIFNELEIHMDAEEQIFYPEVENAGQEELVAESIAEHEVIKDLIEDLRGLDQQDEEYSAKFKVMQENLKHHIEEEQRNMFPFAEKNLKNEMDRMFREMRELKEKIYSMQG